MNKSNKFSPEVRERAVRLIQENRVGYPSLWAAVESLAPKIGCVPQTLLEWVKRAQIDSGARDGLTTTERERIKESIGAGHGNPGNRSSWRLWNGWPGSIITDCSNPSGIFRRQKPRQTTTGNSPVRSQVRLDLNQPASAKPGAVQFQAARL